MSYLVALSERYEVGPCVLGYIRLPDGDFRTDVKVQVVREVTRQEWEEWMEGQVSGEALRVSKMWADYGAEMFAEVEVQ